MQGDHAGFETGLYDLSAEPAFKADEEDGYERAVEDGGVCFSIWDGAQEGGDDQQADDHADEAVDVFDPHFDRVEVFDV